MNSELYTSFVTSARAIATIGGTSAQNVSCTDSAVVVKAANSRTATSATNVTIVPMPNFFFDVDIPSNPLSLSCVNKFTKIFHILHAALTFDQRH